MYVFSAGNEYTMGDDVNYEGYLNSRFTISVGAVYSDLTHSLYSSSGAPVFISAPGGDGGNMAVAKPVGNGVTDNCGDAGQGTSFACPLISGVVALADAGGEPQFDMARRPGGARRDRADRP